MIKFKIEHDGTKVEFASFDAALEYKSEKNLQEEIVEFEDISATSVKHKYYVDLTPRQLRQILVLNGISLDLISAQLAQLPEPQKSLAYIEWEYSTAMKRSNPLVGQMATALGLSEAQVDAMWEAASKL